jgi:predicted TPR repeat methyltransferase
MDTANPILRRLYTMDGGAEECRDIYRDWARAYDQDTVGGMGYVGPALAAETLAPLLPAGAVVLDAGCGTGLAGAELARLGVTTIDGIDISSEMLAEAAAKGVYRTLDEADLTQPLTIPSDAYDGVICVGVFTNGHVGPSAIAELARVAKPGAPLVFTVHEHAWDAEGYAASIAELAAAGITRTVRITEAPYHMKEGFSCRLCVLEAA